MPARDHFPRLTAALEARKPFMAGTPGAHLLVPSEAHSAMKAELAAARAETEGMFCDLCGGTGHIDTRPDPDLDRAAAGMLGVVPVYSGGSVGACYRCDADGWSPAGRASAANPENR